MLLDTIGSSLQFMLDRRELLRATLQAWALFGESLRNWTLVQYSVLLYICMLGALVGPLASCTKERFPRAGSAGVANPVERFKKKTRFTQESTRELDRGAQRCMSTGNAVSRLDCLRKPDVQLTGLLLGKRQVPSRISARGRYRRTV